MLLFDLNSFITLLLINKVEAFRDSYSLYRVLAWKFDIITASDVLKILDEEKLINEKVENGISKYEITKKGQEFIEANMIKGESLMLEKYKEEQVFITSLFSR